MDKWVKRTMIVFFDELGIEERAQVQLRLAKLAQLIAQHNPLVAAANRSTGRGSNRAVLAAQAQVAAAQAAIEAAEAAAREARQMNFSSAPMTPSFDAGYPTDADMMSMEEQRTSLLSPSPVQSSWRAGRLNTARSTSKTAMPDFDMSEAAEEIESGNESEEEDEEQYASRESDEDAEAVDGDGGDTDSGSDEVSNSSGRDSDANDPLQIMMTSGVSNPSAAQKNQPSRCATGAGRVGRLGAYELIIPEHVDVRFDFFFFFIVCFTFY
jgi:multidrug efflux pump subunit AcrA (membrane-fusion protein)